MSRKVHPISAMYDVVNVNGRNYRVLPNTFPDVPRIEKAPCSPQYWALTRILPTDISIPIERLGVLARFVRDLATLSKCEDRQVAAIIVNSDGTQVYSIGINGGPKGGPQCLCALHDKYTCIHAEANAIAKCTSTDPEKIMLCTLAPCITCASLIRNAGINQVFYIEDYKDNVGIAMLRNLGVHCVKLEMIDKANECIYDRSAEQNEYDKISKEVRVDAGNNH